ncbi:MAG: dihydrodipicolinate synthase family protein [Candidatus Neomarinimicrobiota bacterium]
MPSAFKIAGAFAPILTPFMPDGGSIDWGSYRRHLAFLSQGDPFGKETGLEGIVVLGTNGEFGQLTTAERLAMVEATLTAGTRLAVIVGGMVPDSPEDTLAFVQRVVEYADQVAAVLVAPPFYNVVAAGGVVPEDVVVDFYRHLARVQDRVPLLLYNVPVPPEGPMTAPVTPDVVAALRDEVAIVGVKDSTARLENIPAYLRAKPGLKVLVGSDHVVAGGLAQGAVGSITACGNIFPSAVLAVYQARPGPARQAAQDELSRLRRVIELIPGKQVAIQKLLLYHLGVVARLSPVRDLSKGLTTSERDQILAALEEAAAGLVINQEIQAAIRSLPGS